MVSPYMTRPANSQPCHSLQTTLEDDKLPKEIIPRATPTHQARPTVRPHLAAWVHLKTMLLLDLLTRAGAVFHRLHPHTPLDLDQSITVTW